jgi:hypothetical protein
MGKINDINFRRNSILDFSFHITKFGLCKGNYILKKHNFIILDNFSNGWLRMIKFFSKTKFNSGCFFCSVIVIGLGWRRGFAKKFRSNNWISNNFLG